MDSSRAAELLKQGMPHQEVARQCSLVPTFVSQVQTALDDPAFDQRTLAGQSPDDHPFRLMRTFAAKPGFALYFSSLAAALLMIGWSILRDNKILAHQGTVGPVVAILFAISPFIFHGLLYAHMGEVKRVWRGFLWYFLGFIVTSSIRDLVKDGLFEGTIKLLVATVLLAFVYAAVMVPVAALGGYHRMRVQAQRRSRFSRQQMLEQLFELRSRRFSAGPTQIQIKSWFQNTFFQGLERQLYRNALISGFVSGLLTVLSTLLLDPKGSSFDGGNFGWITAAQITITLGSFFMIILLAMASAHPIRAVVTSVIFALASQIAALGPVGPFGPKYFQSVNFWAGAVLGLILYNALAIGSALAVMIHLNQKRQDALLANQPDALDHEISQLEAVLSPPMRRICVMDVDAYQSSRMKQENDPFESEWSFREYQALITRVTGRHLGVVHSTAGDGAIVGFPSSAEALEAAIALQAEIAVFNAKVNRLNVPFRIRIGLHTGQVQGTLDEIQFTEVIDVAAHVQKAVPVGTIGMTSNTTMNLDNSRFSSYNTKVDGYDIYIVDGIRGPQP